MARAAKQVNTGKKPGARPSAPDPPPRAEDQVNLTDEDSRITKVAGSGFEQCYNTRVVVDTESMLVMVAQVPITANDKEQLAHMVEKVQALPERLNQPANILIDSGYFSEKNVSTCGSAKITPLIAVGCKGHHPGWREHSTDPEPLIADATPAEKIKPTLKTKAGPCARRTAQADRGSVFGIIKSVMGFRHFLMHGIDNTVGSRPTGC